MSFAVTYWNCTGLCSLQRAKTRLLKSLLLNTMEQDVVDNYLREELERCKSNPYYFYTHYIKINGKKATTNLSEKDFNERFNKLQKHN